ncbi:MAG: hypothetical protein ACK2UC_03335 [Anaerolineae bacterium]|jgi:hypothetical protein
MMDLASLDPSPVGVGFLRSAQEHREVPVFAGISYCQAVREAGEGRVLRVLPGSIQVCQWAPIVLGLRPPVSQFEQRLSPRLEYPVAGLLLAPLDQFPGEPEIVLLRATRQVLDSLIATVGRDRLWVGHGGRLAYSVVPLFSGGRFTLRYHVVQDTNAVLALLARSEWWQAVTHWLFRNRWFTAGYDAVISRALADMSMCRNSTVIPWQTGQVNISFFCSGGITWGLNNPDHLTSGWPWAVFQRLRGSLP